MESTKVRRLLGSRLRNTWQYIIYSLPKERWSSLSKIRWELPLLVTLYSEFRNTYVCVRFILRIKRRPPNNGLKIISPLHVPLTQQSPTHTYSPSPNSRKTSLCWIVTRRLSLFIVSLLENTLVFPPPEDWGRYPLPPSVPMWRDLEMFPCCVDFWLLESSGESNLWFGLNLLRPFPLSQ